MSVKRPVKVPHLNDTMICNPYIRLSVIYVVVVENKEPFKDFIEILNFSPSTSYVLTLTLKNL